MSSSANEARSCPLGHTCDQCLWQVQVQKTNPATGELRVDDGCAVTELVQAQVAVFQATHSTGAAIEDFRNRMVEGNDQMAKLLYHHGKAV